MAGPFTSQGNGLSLRLDGIYLYIQRMGKDGLGEQVARNSFSLFPFSFHAYFLLSRFKRTPLRFQVKNG